MGSPHAAALALALLLMAGCAAPDAPAHGASPAAAPAVGATLVPLDAAPPPAGEGRDRGDTPTPGLYAFRLPVGGEVATGLLAVPESPPSAVVAVAHGWGADAAAHRADLEALAGEGAVAVAMDFRGPRGAFNVQAGVEDTVAATLALRALYPDVERAMVYGWSMGGEVALLAAAAAPPGTYAYVFAGAAVADLASFWHEAPRARAAVEAETGGTPAQVPAEYERRSPVHLAAGLAAAGVRRVFLVHGAGDPVVPLEHAERMDRALVDAGQPVSYYVATKDGRTVCAPPAPCLPLQAPAMHEAGRFALMRPFVQHRLGGMPDPAEAAVRGTYDGGTGKYDPSDVG